MSTDYHELSEKGQEAVSSDCVAINLPVSLLRGTGMDGTPTLLRRWQRRDRGGSNTAATAQHMTQAAAAATAVIS